MPKINSPFTNTSNISTGATITSTVANSIKNAINTWIQSVTPTTPVLNVTSAVSLTANNQDVYAGGTTVYTITLPTIPAGDTNIFFNIEKISANKNGATPIAITIVPAGGNTIEGLSSFILYTKGSSVSLNCNTSILGTDWKVTNQFFNGAGLQAKIAQNSVTAVSTSLTKIPFQASIYDPNTDMSTANARYTASVPGLYEVRGNLYITSGTSSDMLVALYKGGAEYERGTALTSGGATALGYSGIVQLAVGEFIEIFGNSSPSKNTLSGTALTYFTVNWLKPY